MVKLTTTFATGLAYRVAGSVANFCFDDSELYSAYNWN